MFGTVDPVIRPQIADMSDRELLEEVVTHLRTVSDVVEAFSESPMIQAIADGQNPLAILMGG